MQNGQQNKHLSWFKVENFKCFEAFEMENIGQFNLIFGDNNTGKTTVLEALLFDEDFNQFLYNLDGTLDSRGYSVDIINGLNFNHIKTLFNFKKRKYNAKFNFSKTTFLKKFSFEMYLNTLINLGATLSSKLSNNVTTGSLPRELIIFKTDTMEETPLSIRFKENKLSYKDYIPFISFSHKYGDDLIKLFSPIQQSKKLKETLINSLSLFILDIEDIELSTLYSTLTVIIWLKNIDTPVPLPSFGDGAKKLFRILVELPICKHRRLMIDEIDSGIHYSRFKDFWKTILVAAKENDVQIFATTHNKEALKYFYEALEELPDYQQDARSFTLSRIKDGSVKAYTQTYEQFEHALLHDIEIRGRQ